jgi:hypothetical protein
MARCIFCCEEKPSLTDEHIIPAALGSNVVLRNAACEDCQRQCNRSFEQRFLKGSNFVAFLRAHLGIRGRRNEPIFGFDQHGHLLTLEVQPGFPPIRIGLGVNGIERPMQVILADEKKQPLHYVFLPNQIPRPILPRFFDALIEDIPSGSRFASLWADGDVISANGWREILEAFVAWSNKNNLLPIASSIAAGEATVPFTLDWRTEYRDRGIAKICFVYFLSTIPKASRFDAAFQHARDYILHGHFASDFWRPDPVLQWEGPHPGMGLGNHKFTYLLATVLHENSVYGLIQLHNMGLFCTRLSVPQSNPFVQDTLTTYLLEKDDNEKYTLRSESFSGEGVRSFADAVRNSGQL